MRSLVLILLAVFFPIIHAKQHPANEPQDTFIQPGTLFQIEKEEPEKILQSVQVLLEAKCKTNPELYCSAKESVASVAEMCATDNPPVLCLSTLGIMMLLQTKMFPLVFYVPDPQSYPPINLLSDPRERLLNQGRPGEFVDTSYVPPFFIDDNGTASISHFPPPYELKGNSDFQNLQEKISYFRFPERDMKTACGTGDDPNYCLGWSDPENQPEDR